MRRSLKLIVDTSKLTGNSVVLHQPNIDINQIETNFPSTATNDEDRKKILKDSAKKTDDFFSNYKGKYLVERIFGRSNVPREKYLQPEMIAKYNNIMREQIS